MAGAKGQGCRCERPGAVRMLCREVMVLRRLGLLRECVRAWCWPPRDGRTSVVHRSLLAGLCMCPGPVWAGQQG